MDLSFLAVRGESYKEIIQYLYIQQQILLDPNIDVSELSRPHFNEILKEAFQARRWEDQPAVFDEPSDPSARMDFLKERVGIEVGFGHPSFLGIDLLKFQVTSYSGMDKIRLFLHMVSLFR